MIWPYGTSIDKVIVALLEEIIIFYIGLISVNV